MKKEQFPKIIPIFPLSNFIIFPKTTVPLNIFEPRYIDMVNDSMKSNKLHWYDCNQNLIQKINSTVELFSCMKLDVLGKITSFKETDDGRFLIELKGLNKNFKF